MSTPQHGRSRSVARRLVGAATALSALMAAALLTGTAQAEPTSRQDGLAAVRQATAAFHSIQAAEAAGYDLGYTSSATGTTIIDGCIAHPTEGAMGFHYFNDELLEDPGVDPLAPEGLVYRPGPGGRLHLVAVEWVVPKAVWESAGNTGVPQVLGTDLHILNPVLNWYIHHAWIWKPNPSGMFADWNPRVVCP